MSNEEIQRIFDRLGQLPRDARRAAIYITFGECQYLAARKPNSRIRELFAALDRNVADEEKKQPAA